MAERGARIPLIAKIEKHEALSSIDAILAEADGIMVARGDLGVETPLEHVPLLQKMLIEKANRAGKPVITATQMLLSMVENPRPTRAEVGDVANAILDGTDAVMLSEETASGRYPEAAVATMQRIAEDTETAFPFEQWMRRFEDRVVQSLPEAVAGAACELAEHIGAALIVAWTESGATARLVAKHRPRRPILALSSLPATARRLALVWGVIPLVVEEGANTDAMLEAAPALAQAAGLAQAGRDGRHHRRHPDGRRPAAPTSSRPPSPGDQSRTVLRAADAARRATSRSAIFFFILGVIGILVPVMPQIVFFFLSPSSSRCVFPSFRRGCASWRHKYPKLDASYRKWRRTARRTASASEQRRRSAAVAVAVQRSASQALRGHVRISPLAARNSLPTEAEGGGSRRGSRSASARVRRAVERLPREPRGGARARRADPGAQRRRRL